MNDDRRGSEIGTMVAFGAGTLLGAVGALLLAPKSGEETRRELGDIADQALDRSKSLADQARAKTHETVDAAGKFVRDQKERVGLAFHEGRDAYLRETSKR